MVIDMVTVGPLEENCYLLVCSETSEAVVIDPGDEAARIAAVVSVHEAKLKYILATHGHFDHILAVAGLKERFDVPFLMPEMDWPLAERAHQQATFVGWIVTNPVPHPDGFVHEGYTIQFGTVSLDVLHVPGHTPGHVAYLSSGHIFSGDVLFSGSIGRTDFPYSDFTQLQISLATRLLTLPQETVVHPGHGPLTTIAQEKRTNPYLLEILRDG